MTTEIDMTELLDEAEVDEIPEITLDKADLMGSLTALAKFVPTKSQNVSLCGVRGVMSETNGLILQVSNGITSAEITVTNVKYDGPAIDDDAPLTFLVPMRILLPLAAGFPDGDITLEIHDDRVFLCYAKLRYQVITVDDSGFPPLSFGTKEDWDSVTPIVAEEIMTSIQYAFKASAKDTNKPNLQGVRITRKGAEASFFATDTRHMLEITSPLAGGFNVDAFTLPPNGIEALNTMFNPTDEIKIIAHAQGIWLVRHDNLVRVAIRGFQQPYPDMSKVMDLPQNFAAVINKDELASTLKRMGAYVNKDHQKILFRFDGLFLELGIQTSEGEAIELITVSSYTDADGKLYEDINETTPLGFRLSSMADAIAAFKSDEIVFRMTNNRYPILVHSTDPEDKARYITSLIH